MHPAQRHHRIRGTLAHARCGADGQERRRGYITDIRNSGAHLLALINDILDYSKLEADHLPFAETIFDLGQFLHDGLRQCVVNLLANAIKVSPGGEVALSAETVEAKGIEIRIADTGCGIPPDQLDQAPFASTARSGGARRQSCRARAVSLDGLWVAPSFQLKYLK